MKPIRVEPAGPRYKLDSASRLNYGKPYTVEYNVKVWFIGKVHPNSEWHLATDYNRIHPPIEPRGSQPDAADAAATYSGSFVPNTYATGSSYPDTSGYSLPYSSMGASQIPYTMNSLSGAGTGFSSYTSHPSLDSVVELGPEEDGPSGVYDSNPQRYGEHGDASRYGLSEASNQTPMSEDPAEAAVKNAEREIFDDNFSEDTTPFDSIHFDAQLLDIAGIGQTSTQAPSSTASVRTSRGSSLARTQTSMTANSMIDQPLIRDQLVDLLRQDAELRTIFELAAQKPTWDRFEKNLRRCLIQLSKDLFTEIQSSQSTQAAKVIHTFARNTAQEIKRTLELHQLTIQTSQRMERVYPLFNPGRSESNQLEMNSEGSEDDEMDPVDDIEGNTEGFKQLELLIVSSKSFEMFKERFDLCVNPEQARFAVFKQWPTTTSMSSQHQISYDIEWDLKAFVDNHVRDPKRIGELITLTGDSMDAQALSSLEYLSYTWPRVGAFLLEGIQLLLVTESKGKLHQSLGRL